MSTALTTLDRESIVASYSVPDDKIAEWSERFLPLKIAGIDDVGGLQCVHAARMVVKNARVEVEKTRKQLKADALEYGRVVDAEAKRITNLLSPIEAHLESQENQIAFEKERIRKDKEELAERAATAKCQERINALKEIGGTTIVSYEVLYRMTDEAFAVFLATETEAARVRAQESEQRKAEAERLAAERAELDKIKAEQQAEANRLAAERKKIDDAEAERKRLADLETARAGAAEKSRIETEQRLQREADTATPKTESEAAEKERIKDLQPIRERIVDIADEIDAVVVSLPVGSPAKTMTAINAAIDQCVEKIRDIADKL